MHSSLRATKDELIFDIRIHVPSEGIYDDVYFVRLIIITPHPSN